MTTAVPTTLWPVEPIIDSPDLAHYREMLPPWAVPYWDDAVGRGDAEAAEALNAAISDEKRAFLCGEFFYGAFVPLEVFRTFLAATWQRSHNHLLALLRSQTVDMDGYPETPEGWMELEQGVIDTVARMFAEAQYDIPETLPEEITVYRGTYGLPQEVAMQGLSWSLSRHKATWFADRGPYCLGIYPRNEFNRDHGPLLLTARVKRSDVLMLTNDRHEQEIVARDVALVSVETAEPEVVTFSSIEEAMAAHLDPVLMDLHLSQQQASSKPAKAKGRGFGRG